MLLASVAALIAIWITACVGCSPKEPRYKGHKLHYWLCVGDNRETARAIRAVGTNAIPIAIKWMSKDYNQWSACFHRPGEAADGYTVLRFLGDQAQPAIPALVELTKNKDPEVRHFAFTFFWCDFWPGDAVMRPVLLRLTNDPDRNIRYFAAEALADLEGRSEYLGPRKLEDSPPSAPPTETNPAATNQPPELPRPRPAQDARPAGQRPSSPSAAADWSRMNPKEKFQALTRTTPAYRQEALRLVVEEANRVASELQLPESLPISETNLVAWYLSAPHMAHTLGGAVGNITTSNYTYYISVANKFSFLVRAHLQAEYDQLRQQYLWPMSRMDTNAAYQVATQFLAAASMDAKALNRDCNVHILPFTPEGPSGRHFVPVYWVYWVRRSEEGRGSVATVELLEPTRTLRQLRVEKPEYILRRPLAITNLKVLLSDTNVLGGPRPPMGQSTPESTR